MKGCGKMKLNIRTNQMEEVEGLHNEYPYCYHYADLSKTAVPWHWHEALELNLVAEGSVRVSTANRTLTFRKNQAFFLNTNVLASMEQEGGCVLHSHLFHSVFLSGHFKSVFETKYLNPVLQNRQLEIVPLLGETAASRQLIGKLWQLTSLQESPDCEFETRNLLSQIWLLLLEQIRTADAVALTPVSKNQDRLLTMLAFIQENFTDKMTLEDIASSAAISTRECLRCFRDSIHQSPMDYLIEYRVRTARKLLETTDLPVTQIAMECGFNSPSYFTKQFHRIYGKTPLACRKENESLKA